MRVCLVGNQNSGKTSLFNALTGMNQKVGNWPGVTIDRKEGIVKGTDLEIIDLPGVYSLNPFTSEEKITRDFLLNEQYDVILNIIDSTSIERSLYLTTQLIDLGKRVVIALNMCDLLKKKGYHVHEDILSEVLNLPVIKVSALKNEGIDKLIKTLESMDKNQISSVKIFDDDIEKAVAELSLKISVNQRYNALKILEEDNLYLKKDHPEAEEIIQKLKNIYNKGLDEVIADERYNFIVKNKSLFFHSDRQEETISDKLDKVFLNKYVAIPIFVVIMALVYFLSVGLVGNFTTGLIESLFELIKTSLRSGLESISAWPWLISLLCDGIITGIGAVLNFIPQLIILFICISILETCGYMSRISFFLDRLFRKFGLSGKSIIPFIVGSGCSVPGIMTARTIENEKEKKVTILLTPFIPCSAKLPVITLFTTFFFGSLAWLASVSLYFLAIIIILLSAILFKKVYMKDETEHYILELPEYKKPSFRYVTRDVAEKVWSFIKRAGTIIFVCSVIVWFLTSFSWTFQYGVDIENSILASIGSILAYIFYPVIGHLSWAATVSALLGIVAKEQIVSTMAVIAGLADNASNGSLIFANSGIFSFFNGVNGYAFMVFCLFSAPCLGAISAMRKELNSRKAMFKAIAYQTLLAYVLASLINGIGTLVMLII